MMTSSNGNIFRFTGHLCGKLSKQSWGWWFGTLPRPLWRHCNGNIVCITDTLSGASLVPRKRLVFRTFDVFFVIRPNDLLQKIAVPSFAMPRHSCDVTSMIYIMLVQIWWTKASFFIAIKRLCSSYILNCSSMQLTFCECQQCRSKIYT